MSSLDIRSGFKTSDQVQGQGAGRSRKRSIHGYVSIYRRPATQPLEFRWGFETTYSDILQARQHLHGIIRQSPFDRSAALSDQTNMEVYLKAECLQRTGSFKLRGAYHKIASLSSEEKTRGNLDYPLLRQIITDFSGITT